MWLMAIVMEMEMVLMQVGFFEIYVNLIDKMNFWKFCNKIKFIQIYQNANFMQKV